MLIIRLAGLFFAFIQITLALRLVLPFVEVPEALLGYVPALLDITDVWLLPVVALAERFEITGLAGDIAEVGDASITGPEEFEPLVIVAMLFWGVVAWFGLFVLRLIFRPVALGRHGRRSPVPAFGAWSGSERYLRVRSRAVAVNVVSSMMAQHEMPAGSGDARSADPADQADPAEPSPPSPRSSRWAISRGTLLALMAVLLPAAASLLAAVLTEDIAYHLRSGALMLESGSVLDEDLFTFTAFGEPWLNQQWAASVVFAAIYDAAGWLGLLVLRAVLIGVAFGLVYLACRATAASRMVSSLVTLGAFVVAATNLALRAQLFGIVFFAAVLSILAWRRKHPWLLVLIPLLMVAWANTHGSFFIGWAAIGVAFLEDLRDRRRLAAATFVVGVLSVLATLVNPWGLEMWTYVVELSSSPVIAALVAEWQAPTLESATGFFFFASVALVAGLLLYRGRVISWVQVLWLGGLILLSLMASRSVVWWALGAAPIVAILLGGLEIRGHRVGDPAYDEPSGVGYTAIAGLLVVLTLAVVPFYRPSDPLYGPDGIVQHAPRGVTEALAAAVGPDDRLYAAQRWGSWLEFALPGVPVMVDTRIELLGSEIWADYLDVAGGRADWPQILERWDVSLVAVEAENDELLPFIAADGGWVLLHEDDEGAVYRRVE